MYAREVLEKFVKLDLNKISETHLGFVDPLDSIIARNKRLSPSNPELHESLSVYERIPLDEAKALEFLQIASRWLPANPSKPKIVNDVNKSYLPVKTTKADGNKNKVANCVDENGNFPFSKAIDEASHILLNGVRGVGKTSFVNYWLNNSTRDFEKQGKFWFRIDATKVHEIWKASDRDKNVTDLFGRYFVYHALYVVLRYGGAFQPNRIASTRKIAAESKEFEKFVSHLNAHCPENLKVVMEAFTAAENLEPLSKDKSVEIVQRAIVNRTKLQNNAFIGCKQVLSKMFDNLDYKCIAIIDGIDNIAWTKSNNFYRRTCQNFSNITNRISNAFGKDCCLIFASRPETHYEIKHAALGSPGQAKGITQQVANALLFQEWYVFPPNASDILMCKINAAKDPNSFVDQRMEFALYETDIKRLNQILEEVSMEVRQYPTAMIANLKSALELVRRDEPSAVINEIYNQLNEDNLLQYVFDNDVRAYLDNVLKVFFLRRSVLRKDLPQAEFQRRLMQFTFMNGKPWFRSKDHYQHADDSLTRAHYVDRGMVFPNVFWWPTDKSMNNPNKWCGLMGLRMLQLAKFKREFCFADLLYTMKLLFGYNEELLFEVAEAYVAYGLFDIKGATEQNFFNNQEFGRSKVSRYMLNGFITAKGELLSNILFARPDLLYFYALDTPQKIDLVQDRTTMVRTFIEPRTGSVEDDFFAAAIPTVATFLLHVTHYSKRETENIKKRKVNSQANLTKVIAYYGTKQALLKTLALPRNYISNFGTWAENGMSVKPYRSKQKTDEIQRDIIGVFGQFTERKH